MIRVAFLLNLSDNWLGGVNYFRNLLCAISELPQAQIAPVVFIGKKSNRKLLNGFPNVEIIESDIFDAWSFSWIKRKSDNKLFFQDRMLDNLLKKYKIDIVSHLSEIGGKMQTPALGWIPDFQHKHLPHLFTARELGNRDRSYRLLCNLCNAMILSSNDAKKDLKDFAPGLESKVHVLQFVVQPVSNEVELTFEQLEHFYGFKGKYLYVPNQFWAHKNYEVLLGALKVLKNQNRMILIISTGSTEDYRNPKYYGQLEQYIRENDLAKNFRVLGKVPYSHVVSIANHCQALINPSLFEGWSTSVEEAKSLGKEIILSDIAVHREQNPPKGRFFDPNNPEELAEILWEVWLSIDNNALQVNQQNLKQRTLQFAEKFENIVIDTVK